MQPSQERRNSALSYSREKNGIQRSVLTKLVSQQGKKNRNLAYRFPHFNQKLEDKELKKKNNNNINYGSIDSSN